MKISLVILTLLAFWLFACDPETSGSSGSQEETSFTVTFAVDGGSAIAPLTVSKGAKIVQPKAPTKPDHSFVGWYTDQKFSEVFDFKTKTITRISRCTPGGSGPTRANCPSSAQPLPKPSIPRLKTS